MRIRILLAAGMILLIGPDAHAEKASDKTIRAAVVQTLVQPTLDANRTKLLSFIQKAGQRGCQLVVFPENALFWPDIASHTPSRTELDTALEQIRAAAKQHGVCVVFGTAYPRADGKFQNRGIVVAPDGRQLLAYFKNSEVPQSFEVFGVRCNLVICSDRGYLEHSDLPCLVHASQIIRPGA